MPEFRFAAEGAGLWIIRAVADAGLVKSNSEARRMIKQKAVRVDGESVTSEDMVLAPRAEPSQVQVGRRGWARIHAEPPAK